MSASPSDSGSYVRRNLPLLIVGAAAIAGIVAILAVAVDQLRDDDEALVTTPRTFVESGRSDSFADGFGRLEGLFGNRFLLGVALDQTDDGLLVQNVVDGSPAYDAGIEVGDQIVEIDGDRVQTVEELREAIAAIEVGDEYELTVRRDGDSRTLTVERGMDAAAAVAELLDRLEAEGFDLERRRFGSGGGFDFDFDDLQPRGQFDSTPRVDPFAESRLRPALGVTVVQTNEGVRVVCVEPGSVADDAGIEPDDIILEVDGVLVSSIEALRAALPSMTPQSGLSPGAMAVELLVRRGEQELTVEARFQFVSDPVSPSLPNATPEPDRSTERRGGGPAAPSPADTPTPAATPAATAAAVGESPGFDDLEVFRGTVEMLTDSQITLGGPRGSISFALTEGTTIVGAAPSVGGTSSVAANAEGEAVLVLTVG